MKYAAAAAADHQFELVLFSLYHTSIHALNARSSVETLNRMLDRYRAKLESVAAGLRDSYGIKVAAHMASGNFHEEIAKCYTEEEADLIVMGMADKSLEQDLLGNTTTAAIHSLRHPVIAIPADAEYRGIKKILFACDITRGVHARILSRVKSLASGFGAEVEVFHVSKKVAELEKAEKTTRNLESIGEELAGIDYYYKNVVAGEVISAIREELEELQADLLVMVPYKYGFWGSFVHRSKTRIMASGSNIPLLSIPL